MAVYESTRPMDLRFVAKALRDNGLSPWPVKGWYSRFPLQWNAGERSVQLEAYEWGMVAFVADSAEPPWASTLVLVGDIDWERGEVRERGDVEPIPIPWIADIDFESAQEPVMPVTDESIPECLALHEHCPTCDGGLNTATGSVESPCLWRSRCYALKLHILTDNVTIDGFLDALPNPVELHAKLAEIERQHLHAIPPPAAPLAASRGVARGTLSATHKHGKKYRRKLRSPERFDKLEHIVRSFLLRLKRHLAAAGYGWRQKRSQALPGECYVHRVTQRSNYLVVYCAAKGKYGKVAVVKYKTVFKCIDIGFKAAWDDAVALRGTTLRRTASLQAPVEWHGVRDRKTARKAARLLVRMITDGVIELPSPRSKP